MYRSISGKTSKRAKVVKDSGKFGDDKTKDDKGSDVRKENKIKKLSEEEYVCWKEQNKTKDIKDSDVRKENKIKNLYAKEYAHEIYWSICNCDSELLIRLLGKTKHINDPKLFNKTGRTIYHAIALACINNDISKIIPICEIISENKNRFVDPMTKCSLSSTLEIRKNKERQDKYEWGFNKHNKKSIHVDKKSIPVDKKSIPVDKKPISVGDVPAFILLTQIRNSQKCNIESTNLIFDFLDAMSETGKWKTPKKYLNNYLQYPEPESESSPETNQYDSSYCSNDD